MPGVRADQIDDGVIERLVTSGEGELEVLGRLFATSAAQLLHEFLQAEHRRGTKPVDLIMALVRFSAGYLGAVAVAEAKAGHEGALFDVIAEALRSNLDLVATHLREEQGR